MKAAGRAEWTKLRTDAGNAWLTLGMVVLTLAVGAAVAMTSRCDTTGCGGDPVRLGLSGVLVGQVVVAIVAVLTVGDEYGTGMMRTTLTAVPRRLTVLFSKSAVLSAVLLVAGTVSVLGSLLIAGLVQPGRGFTEEHGFTALSPTDGATLRAAAGSVLYLVLIGLLSLGVALAVRNSATAVGIVLALLFVLPVLAQVVADPDWQRHLRQISPMTAGLAVQTTVRVDDLPIGPWQGLGVLALWAAGAMTAGGWLLRTRDA
ncbi:ABC transporter permease [Streptomyces sp. BH-SS-21]|uniref:ABC transporter permease n=1 Tax=Streptomyces liliiviolaceus TaxID=2823109 RepID=A0A941BDB4_9ACTN|nr:ABC transporter permease [Streptomyces liliiviolaceus]MBQ0853933.1 ABC transporter permease [Streptomyces liliiviolaceus]